VGLQTRWTFPVHRRLSNAPPPRPARPPANRRLHSASSIRGRNGGSGCVGRPLISVPAGGGPLGGPLPPLPPAEMAPAMQRRERMRDGCAAVWYGVHRAFQFEFHDRLLITNVGAASRLDTDWASTGYRGLFAMAPKLDAIESFETMQSNFSRLQRVPIPNCGRWLNYTVLSYRQ